ncbi:hypothetical protein V2J09_023860 [Rumex salicifolius]
MATQCTCGADGGSGGGGQPKKLLKRKSTKKGERENPYSDRGVEKFSALLAEIEEKKRTIYSKVNPEEVSVIRFVHSGDNKLKPVVVRTKSNKLASKRKEFDTSKTMEKEEEKPIEVAAEHEKEETPKKVEIIESGADDEKKKTKKKSLLMEAVISGIKANQPWMSNYRVLEELLLVAAPGYSLSKDSNRASWFVGSICNAFIKKPLAKESKWVPSCIISASLKRCWADNTRANSFHAFAQLSPTKLEHNMDSFKKQAHRSHGDDTSNSICATLGFRLLLP